MTGPKHLWSGDWESESSAASDAGQAWPAPRPDEPGSSPAPEPPAPTRSDRTRSDRARPTRVRVSRPAPPRLRRPVWLGVLAVLIVAAAAFGVAGLIGGSSGSGSADPTAGLAATTAGAAPRPVSWLGMEILTVPPGVAVIDTVGLNSPAARAGLEPGEQIVQVNNRRIGGAGDIAAAIRGLHAGDTVQIQASNGAASYATGITLAAPPTPYP